MTKHRITAIALILAVALTGAALAQRARPGGERADRDDVVTREGTITAIGRPFATLQAGGSEHTLHLGPQWFWDRNDYDLDVGDDVTVTAQMSKEGDTVHLYLHTIRKGDRTFRFADEDGVPLWSGGRGGRGMGRGSGQGPGPARGPGCPCGQCPCCGQGQGR